MLEIKEINKILNRKKREYDELNAQMDVKDPQESNFDA